MGKRCFDKSADCDSDLLQEYGVRVRFIGRREMLPEYLRIAIKDMEEMTGRNQE
jgi:undecaprenyl pyrophosphate synthase